MSRASPKPGEPLREKIMYGVLPESLALALLDASDWSLRSASVEAFHRTIANLDDVSALLPHMDGILVLLSSLLADNNFKISLTALYIIGDIVTKIGLSVKPYLTTLLPMLINKFTDNKIIIRQANVKVITHLMHVMTPKPVISIALHYTSHENARLKEEVVNLVIVAMLLFTRFDFEFPSLIADLLTTLRDSKPKLKYVAVEALSVIAHRITSAKLLRLLKSYGVEDETLQMLQMRFQNPLLPVLNSDGLVEHVIDNRSAAASPRVFQGSSAFNSFPSSIGPSSVTSYSGFDSYASPTPPENYHHHQVPNNMLAFQSYSTAYPSRQPPVKSAPTPLTRPPIQERNGLLPQQQQIMEENGLGVTQQNRFVSGGRSAPRTKMPWKNMQVLEPTMESYQSVEFDNSGRTSRTEPRSSLPMTKNTTNKDVTLDVNVMESITQGYDAVSISPEKPSSMIRQPKTVPSTFNEISTKIIETGSSSSPPPFDKNNIEDESQSSYHKQYLHHGSHQQSEVMMDDRSLPHGVRVRKSKLHAISPSPSPQVPNHYEEEVGSENNMDMDMDMIKTSIPSPIQNKVKTRLIAIATTTQHTFQQSKEDHDSAVSDSNTNSAENDTPIGRVNSAKHKREVAPSGIPVVKGKFREKSNGDSMSPTTIQSSQHPVESEQNNEPASAQTKKVLVTSPKKPQSRSPEKRRANPNQRVADLSSADDLRNELIKLRSATEWEQKVGILEYLQTQFSVRPNFFMATLHDAIMGIVNEIANLRSAVSKTATVCVSEMFVVFGKSMDMDIDITLSVLLKKCGENSNFMTEAVEAALLQLSIYTSFMRALPTLLAHGDNKNANIRSKVAELMCHFITSLPEGQLHRYATSSADMEKLMPVLVIFLRDGILETKANARRILFHLQRVPEWERLSNKLLSGTQAMDVKKALTLAPPPPLQRQENNSSPTKSRGTTAVAEHDGNTEGANNGDNNASGRPTGSGDQSSPIKRKKGSNALPQAKPKDGSGGSIDMEQLAANLQELTSKDWKQRLDALSELHALLNKTPNLWSNLESGVVVKIFDVLIERLHDGNSKVQITALQVLRTAIKNLERALEPVIHQLTTTLCNNLATSNASVRNPSGECLDSLMTLAYQTATINNSVTCTMGIVQAVASYLNHGSSPRVKPTVMKKLISFIDMFTIESSSSTPPRLTPILKQLLPFITKTLSETKNPAALVSNQIPPLPSTDIKQNNVYLIQALYRCYGKTLLDTLQSAIGSGSSNGSTGNVSQWMDKSAGGNGSTETNTTSSPFNFNVGVVSQDTYTQFKHILSVAK